MDKENKQKQQSSGTKDTSLEPTRGTELADCQPHVCMLSLYIT